MILEKRLKEGQMFSENENEVKVDEEKMKKTAEFFNPYPRSNSEGHFSNSKRLKRQLQQQHKPLVSMKFLKMISPDFTIGNKLRVVGKSSKHKEPPNAELARSKSFKRDYSLKMKRVAYGHKANKTALDEINAANMGFKTPQTDIHKHEIKFSKYSMNRRHGHKTVESMGVNHRSVKLGRKKVTGLPSIHLPNRKNIQTAEAYLQHSHTSKKALGNPFFATGGSKILNFEKISLGSSDLHQRESVHQDEKNSQKAFILESYKKLVLEKRSKKFNKRAKSIDQKKHQRNFILAFSKTKKIEGSIKTAKDKSSMRNLDFNAFMNQERKVTQNSDRVRRMNSSGSEDFNNDLNVKSEFDEPSFYPKFEGETNPDDSNDTGEQEKTRKNSEKGHLFDNIQFKLKRNDSEKKRLMMISMHNIKNMIKDKEMLEKNLGISSGRKNIRKFKLQKRAKYSHQEPLPVLSRHMKKN